MLWWLVLFLIRFICMSVVYLIEFAIFLLFKANIYSGKDLMHELREDWDWILKGK